MSSPDQKLRLELTIGSKTFARIYHDNQVVIPDLEIGMQMNIGTLDLRDIREAVHHSVSDTLRPLVPHKDALIPSHYNVLVLEAPNFKLEFRAYNDGLAYRFHSLATGQMHIRDEQISCTFPKGTISYFPREEQLYSHYERDYEVLQLDTLDWPGFCSLPVLMQTPDHINVLITESGLTDYPALFFQAGNGPRLNALFPPYVTHTEPDTLAGADRNERITGEASYIAQTNGPRAFPWRIFLISDQDADLIESNLVYQLAQPKEDMDFSWVKPGKVAWDWYNANNLFDVDFEAGLNTQTYKHYIDFAAEYGIEYVILDEGWTKSTTEIMEHHRMIDVPTIIEYGAAKGVDIILWVLWKPLQENMEAILDLYKSWGAKGIKVDFMQRADQAMVNAYEAIAHACAQRQLLVDYHGAFKPAGLRRAYPNVISYEGVKGNEHNKWSDDIDPEHTVTIPFIRMVAGPMDFTPGSLRNAHPENYLVSFDRPMSLGTRCHQMAMYVVYESPLQMLCESPSVYRTDTFCTKVISEIPVIWDETRVLKAQVADYVVIARRKGSSWYIGAMNDDTPRSLRVALPFLEDREYTMEWLQDGPNTHRHAEDYQRRYKQITADQTIDIHMASGGGWLAKLQPH